MIILEKMKIKNYRKFLCEEITFDENITAIAGSNNSGKTSVVELLSNIFIDKKDTLKIDDMHVKARLEDEDYIKWVIENEDLTREEKIEQLENMHRKLNNIEIDITVKYTIDTDDLHLFSKFLADVDIEKRNFYFKYLYEYEPVKEEQIIEIFDGMADFREIFSNLNTKVYYCDENFNNEIPISNRADFYSLFNVHCVYAIRKLSDTSDEKQNYLTKQLLNTVKNNSHWKNNLQNLIGEINKLLLDQNLSEEIDNITVSNIKDTLESFAKTNGGNSGSFGVDFKLERKDIEKVLLDFTHIYFEQDTGLRIKESKQGLGYSNLVYLLLEIQRFNEKFDSRKVNLLIFEEPEAHLHPQMENVFIRYISALKVSNRQNIKVLEKVAVSNTGVDLVELDLQSKDDTYAYLQMLITTHSLEMTRTIEIDKMRILRSKNVLETKVYDLNRFLEGSNNKVFYKKFFQFNIIEIIFADKAILFEGDAERLLLKYLIANDNEYENLSSQYISYIQVGGAYAHKYLELIEFLKIKTLIFTDIDYEYSSEKDFQEIESELMQEYNELEIINKIESRETTNETIIKMVDEKIIEKIFKKAREKMGIYLSNIEVCLKFQTEEDGYSRTLEDAILYNLASVKSVFTRITKEDFAELKEMKRLSIPYTKKIETSLRDRVDKLKNKTDFMYSLIESGEIKNAVPNYIKEGLDWLKD
ncbi:ATP-dependent nuclease [Schinkia azotoformans]|uniref:ATP-dependent nuclease n=1 Tax=Schinkia azotoformans TaxID=1454 RepID=UPI002DB66B6D|nr:AAA family ATPase [Schinkia azotoformans]MEC1722663.1 AAA family ATPase [Schinkia azotoformans]MED4415859.1 AAA family ATPase [Schinkia azotoformans]